MNIQEEIKSLKRPDNASAKYVIEAELEDIANLIAIKELEARINEVENVFDEYENNTPRLHQLNVIRFMNNINSQYEDLEQQLLKLKEGK